MSPELFELVGAVVGAVAVFLMVRENAWGWPVGLVNLVAYVVVFGHQRLYGAMGLQVIYIALSLYGWYEWKHPTPSGPLRVSRAPARVLAALLVTGAVFAIAFGAILAGFTDAAAPWADAPLTAMSLVAQTLQTRKWIENWVVWMMANAGYVALYAALGLWPTAGLYAAFLLLAILGLVQWRKTLVAAPSQVRPRRVVLTGSECTGKTSLAASLASAFGAPLSAEFSREYAEARRGQLGPEDVEPIARGQMALLDEAITPNMRLIVHDTDLVSTVVYARHYYGDCAEWILAEARSRRADLYLLCHPDIAWQGDGVRDRPASREEIHEAFAGALSELGGSVVDVRGSFAARHATAAAAVERLLREAEPAIRP